MHRLKAISTLHNILTCVCLLTLATAHAQWDHLKDHYEKLEKDKTPDTLRFIQQEAYGLEDSSELVQIILLRHGEPALHKKGWKTRKEALAFVKAYDSVGIYTPAFTPIILYEGDLTVIHTSSINRSIETATKVCTRADLQRPDSLFREFERKIFSFPNLKLPLKWWLTTSRVLWFMGLNKKGIERFSEAKARAKRGAQFLEQDALKQGKTLLVAHGLLNRYLTKYLKKRGWKLMYDGGHGYLSQQLLVKYSG